MDSLSEHDRQVLMELELSLITDSRDGDTLSACRVLVRAQHAAIWSIVALVLGTVVLTSALTESLVVAGVGLAIMFGASLLLAHHVQSMARASRMARGRHPATRRSLE